jgi:hypothetical protein
MVEVRMMMMTMMIKKNRNWWKGSFTFFAENQDYNHTYLKSTVFETSNASHVPHEKNSMKVKQQIKKKYFSFLMFEGKTDLKLENALHPTWYKR